MKKIIIIFGATVFASIILISCGNSYDTLSKEDLIKNEEVILKDVYNRFFDKNEYINGQRLQFDFDLIYIYCLNINENNIDLNALKKSDINYEWESLTIDKEDIQEMIKNNIPIVQMTFHWIDTKSQTGNNKWETHTYFFPECEMENNKINLGKGYISKDVREKYMKYFPYFNIKWYEDWNQWTETYYENPGKYGMWLDLKNNVNDGKVNINGTIYKISDSKFKQLLKIREPKEVTVSLDSSGTGIDTSKKAHQRKDDSL